MINNEINLIDILNSRLSHVQQSSANTTLNSLPRVYPGQVIDGVHDLVYGYQNINRVFHELVSNSKKAIKEIDRKSKLGNLNDYISGEDEFIDSNDINNRLVISKNGTITDSQFLSLSDYRLGITDGIDNIIATYAVDENIAIIVSKEEIFSFNFVDHKLIPLIRFDENSLYENEYIINTNLIEKNIFQLVTNIRIIHCRFYTDKDLNVILDNTLNIDLFKIYSNRKLIINDVSRKIEIKEVISGNEQLEWYNNFIYLEGDGIIENSDNTIVTLQKIGYFIGNYGIYELSKQSSGYFFLKIIDDESIVKSLKYKREKTEYLVLFNEIGVKTYEVKYDGVKLFDSELSKISNIDQESIEWHWLSETGMIETFIGSGDYVNVNDLLEYGFVPDYNNPTSLAKRIPGAVIADLKYAYVEILDSEYVIISDIHKIENGEDEINGVISIFIPENSGLPRLVHSYDIHEFNVFKEVSVLDVVKFIYSDNHFMFSVKDVGIVKGEIKRDANDNYGMRLANIQKYYKEDVDNRVIEESKIENDNNDIVFLPTNQSVFIFNNKTNKLYSTSMSSDELLDLKISNRFRPTFISKDYNNIVYFTDTLTQSIYKARLSRYYSEKVENIQDIILDLISKNQNSEISLLFKEHLDLLHNKDSAMTRLNNFIYKLKQSSVEDSTTFVSDSTIAYISTGFGLTNVERKTTDENSTFIYGRVSSKTLNSYIGMKTESKRATNSVLFYDTVTDRDNNTTSLNSLSYIAYKLSDNILKLEINVPTTFTYYVNNILGWSKGAHTGSTLERTNLNNGFLSGKLENCFSEYQLVLNREYFKILRVLSASCQLSSAPLGIYSDKKYSDFTHYAMFDSPIINPMCITNLNSDNTYEIISNQNNEVILSFCIFGGDALTITVLCETNI